MCLGGVCVREGGGERDCLLVCVCVNVCVYECVCECERERDCVCVSVRTRAHRLPLNNPHSGVLWTQKLRSLC